MSVKIQKFGDVLKILVPQDAPGKDLDDAAKQILSESGVAKVSLDLKNCSYIQSKALAALIAFKKNASKIGAEFVVTNVCESVFQVLEMANLTMYFTIEEDFSSYPAEELVEKFFEADYADRVSDFISENLNDDYKKILLDILDMDEPLLKYYAILTLGKAHDFSAEERIRQELAGDIPPQVAKAAILVLGWFGDAESKERIYSFLESDLEDVAEAAAASIALLSDESDAERLGKLLSAESMTIKKAAIQSLTLINDDSAFKLLVTALRDEKNEDVKATLIRAISAFNKDGVSDLLIKGLDSESIKMREASAGGLAKIKAKDKINDILKRVTDSDSWVGYFAVKACGEICTPSEADVLMDAYDKVEENVKLAIIEALGKIQNDFSEFYISILNDNNEDIRKEVLAALFTDNKEYAKEAATNLFTTDESWIVRYKALDILDSIRPEGFKKLLEQQISVDNSKYVKEKIQSILDVL
jgi:anti-anti-sigma factor